MANGFGIMKSQLGGTYIGFWSNDVYHGFGRERCQDGTYYQGFFINGYKNGRG